MTMTSIPPKIAIIGAGPTGCMLARLLLHLSSEADIPPPEMHIFESESSPNYRSQGGTLDLHPKTGLAALDAAGLFEKFLQHARYNGDALQVTDKNLRVYMNLAPSVKPSSENDNSPSKHEIQNDPSLSVGVGLSGANKIAKSVSGARPEIDRADLRQLLVESLPPETIHWNKKLKRVIDSSKKSLEFTDGEIAGPYDLVIGADGAWSKVRSTYLAPEVSPIFARIALLDLSIPSPAKETAPKVYDLINKGNLFAYSTGKFVSIQTMSDGSINIYVQTGTAPTKYWNKCKWYFPHNPDQTRQALVADGGPFNNWHPLIKEAIVKATDRCTPRILYQLPVGFRWEHKEGVTLIGDAAHLMTPYAGEGVNVGLMDSLVLGRNIVAALKELHQGQESSKEDGQNGQSEGKEQEKRRKVFDKAVDDYENEMWPRSEKVAKLTDVMKQLWMFTEGSPGSVIATTTSLHAIKDAHWLWHPVIWACVHVYFWGRRLIWGY